MTEIYLVTIENYYGEPCGSYTEPIKAFKDKIAAKCFIIDMEKRSKEYRDKCLLILEENRKLQEPLVARIRAGEMLVAKLKEVTVKRMNAVNALNDEYPDHNQLINNEDGCYEIITLELE
jgi:hypothetical protein